MPLSYFCQGKGYGLALVQAVALIFFILNVKEFDII